MSDKRIADGLKAAIDGNVRVSAPTDLGKGKLLTKERLEIVLGFQRCHPGFCVECDRKREIAGHIAAQAALLDQAETELRAEMRRAYIVGEGCADGAELSEVAAAADLYVRNRLSDLRPPSPDEEGK